MTVMIIRTIKLKFTNILFGVNEYPSYTNEWKVSFLFYLCVCACMCVSMHACVCMHVYVCIYASVYECVCECVLANELINGIGILTKLASNWATMGTLRSCNSYYAISRSSRVTVYYRKTNQGINTGHATLLPGIINS